MKLTLREGPQEGVNQSEDRARGCKNIRKKPWYSYLETRKKIAGDGCGDVSV